MAVAVGGAALSVSGLPQVGVPVSAAGVATIGVGGTLGIGAGGLQIAGGILQGFGGAGFSNAINGTVTLGSSALFAGAGKLAASGAQSASGRAIISFKTQTSLPEQRLMRSFQVWKRWVRSRSRVLAAKGR